MPRIDLRSDTVTTPTEEMRRAMAAAEVGDDVYGEDPTVNRLEEVAAERIGKEAALFVPSGTMANLVAVLSHTRRGDEVVLEADSHVYYYEVGGLSAVAGAVPRLIQGRRGKFGPEDVRAAVRAPNIHFPRPSLLCVENTHNRAGGTVWTPEEVRAVAEAAHNLGLRVHMDGARVFNAAVALGRPVREIVAPVDSVMFCLSKGLGAPVGSVLCGSREFVAAARKYRKMLGGGMRQAGVIAAAGLVALETMVERLAEDHANARRLAEGLAEIPGFRVDLETVQTNMVMADVSATGLDAPAVVERLAAEGVLTNAMDRHVVRFVTHKDVSAADIDAALAIVARAVAALR